MEVVDTTTIRVRRSTQERLAEEARLAGMSVSDLLENAASLLKEQRLLEDLARRYEEHCEEIHAEMKDWLDKPVLDDDWSDVLVADD